jgi:hypothetical protein
MKQKKPTSVHAHPILKSEQFTHDVSIYKEKRKNEHTN